MSQITIDTKYIHLVRRMRHSQKTYFEHRNSVDLRYAKRLENEVDKWLDELYELAAILNARSHHLPLDETAQDVPLSQNNS